MLKKYHVILISLLTLLSLSGLVRADIESIAMVKSTDKGLNIALPAPFNQTVFVGTFSAQINGSNTKLYCIDLNHNLVYNQQYQDVMPTDSLLTYILNNYYPYKTLPYAGALAETREAAAVQLALWHLTDNLNISAINNSSLNDVKARALSIVNDAKLNAHTFSLNTFKIVLPPQSFSIGSPVSFTVQAFSASGIAMPDVQITLSSSSGTLSTTTVKTGVNGVTPVITLTPAPGVTSAAITASGVVGIPSGTKYFHVADPNGKQKLILATPTIASRTIQQNIAWFDEIKLKVEKTADKSVVNNGDEITYSVKVTNIGNVDAQDVKVSDQLQSILRYLSSSPAGEYNELTGIWNAGTLSKGESKTLKIKVKVNYAAANATTFNLNAVKDFNLFVIDTLIQPSSDTEGRVAVGGYADLKNYSVGDKLPANSGDVLIVGTDLHFLSGRVYNGRTVYGQFITSKSTFTSDSGIVKGSVLDFPDLKNKLENLSDQLSTMAMTDTIKLEYSTLYLTGSNSDQNVFYVDGNLFGKLTDVQINAPAGSTILVNVMGDSVVMHGGFAVTGTKSSRVILNFPEAKYIKVSNIDVTAAMLAPRASLDFPTGLISGQVITRCAFGSGQFNLVPFDGAITRDTTISNFANIVCATKDNMPTIPNFAPSQSVVYTGENSATSVGGEIEKPENYQLSQNYPNPFNPETKINYSIPEAGYVTLKVYDLLGKEIASLVSDYKDAGSYTAVFNASKLSSGIYIYRIQAGKYNQIRKMQLIK